MVKGGCVILQSCTEICRDFWGHVDHVGSKHVDFPAAILKVDLVGILNR